MDPIELFVHLFPCGLGVGILLCSILLLSEKSSGPTWCLFLSSLFIFLGPLAAAAFEFWCRFSSSSYLRYSEIHEIAFQVSFGIGVLAFLIASFAFIPIARRWVVLYKECWELELETKRLAAQRESPPSEKISVEKSGKGPIFPPL